MTLNLCAAIHFLKRAGEAIEARSKYEQIDARIVHKQRVVRFVFANSSKISYNTAQQIVDEAWKYKNSLLLLAIMGPEAEYNPSAASKTKDGKILARGVAQINYQAHSKMLHSKGIIKHPRDLYDIEANVKAADVILSLHLGKAKGDIEQGLAGYRGGRDGKYNERTLRNLAQLYLLTR